MRYIKLRTTVERVVDEVIDDDSTIQSILLSLKNNEIDCIIRLTDGPKMCNVRIDAVDDDGFSFRVINRSSTLSKKAQFNEVDYVEINTDADLLCRSKPNISRWTLLDPTSD